MITGELRNQVNQVWDAFWSGGISNPLEVIEQITYLLFLRRLDDLHTLEENKSTRLKQPMEHRIFPEGNDKSGMPYEHYRWSRFKNFEAREMFTVIGEHVFPVPAHPRRQRVQLCPAHEGRPLHHPYAGVAGQGGGPAGQRAHGGPRHQGRHLRVHAEQDRHRRAERPVPNAAPHHQAHGGDGGAPAQRHHLRPRLRHLRLPGGGGRIPAGASPRNLLATPSCASTSTTACSTASTSTTPCCASAA